MPELLRAAFAAPMTPGLPLLEDAAVVVDGQDIVDVGTYGAMRRAHSGPVRDLGQVTLAPATFNSHVHLEMCHLLGRTTSGQGFVAWITSLLSQPLYDLDPARVRAELLRLEQAGAAFLADISTHNAPVVGEILAGSGLGFTSFREAIGSAPVADPAELMLQVRAVEDCGWGVMSVAGHALYSTSPQRLRAAKAASAGLPYSLHLAEHTDEDAILMTGKSAFMDLLMERGVISEYTAPGKRPVPLAVELGLLDEDTLCVHCVTATNDDVALIAGTGASVCLCPRSNDYIGVGRAPVAQYLQAGVNVCLGTDGLCSNTDLNPYGEVAWLLANAPELDLGLCGALALVTTNPARFFGRTVPMAARLGSLEPGKLARFSVVPQAVLDICSQR